MITKKFLLLLYLIICKTGLFVDKIVLFSSRSNGEMIVFMNELRAYGLSNSEFENNKLHILCVNTHLQSSDMLTSLISLDISPK